jgi:hypothetical protein
MRLAVPIPDGVLPSEVDDASVCGAVMVLNDGQPESLLYTYINLEVTEQDGEFVGCQSVYKWIGTKWLFDFTMHNEEPPGVDWDELDYDDENVLLEIVDQWHRVSLDKLLGEGE